MMSEIKISQVRIRVDPCWLSYANVRILAASKSWNDLANATMYTPVSVQTHFTVRDNRSKTFENPSLDKIYFARNIYQDWRPIWSAID